MLNPTPIDPSVYDHLRNRFNHYAEALEQLCKGKPRTTKPEDIKEKAIYVLDWRPDQPDTDSITVDYVEKIYDLAGFKMVDSRNADCQLETFAEHVVAGPFYFTDKTVT